jgi:anthranilate synthase/aminodeoxychorismate synthase-like glutamine amidotransferase
MTLNVLFIDNFDSFVFNLVDEFERRGATVDVWRNDIPAEQALSLVNAMAAPRLVVLSPGPGTPETAGNNMEIIRSAPPDLSIFGVCLGHQCMVEALGGMVGRAPEIVHGKPGTITHNGKGIFAGLPSPMTAGRYHSLVGTAIPESLEVTATLGELVMGVSHRERKVAGVQFHPESILTPFGGRLIQNVIDWASVSQQRN